MLQTLAVFSFLAAGCFFLALPHAPHVSLALVHILHDPDACTFIGFSILAIALLFLFGFSLTSRGRYLRIHMGTQIDAKVVRKTLRSEITKAFPRRMHLTDLDIFRERHLELRVTTAPMTPEERTKLLQQAEKHLATLLAQRFGYQGPFTIQMLSRK
jgi:hypothetical protein